MKIKKEDIIEIYNLFVEFNIYCDYQGCEPSEKCPECFMNFLNENNMLE